MTITADQIDKDLLLKDFLPEPKRPGVWNFYNPKNLYLTDLQGKLYLESMDDERYSSKFHDKTEILIANNAEKIADNFTDSSVLIVDMGPGYPKKTLPIIDALRRKNIEIEYWAVDVNEYFGNIAKDAVAERGVERSFAKKMLFENTTAQIKASGIKSPKLIIIGLTIMNFESEYILRILSECAGNKEDICLSAIDCADGASPKSFTEGYETEVCEKFLFLPLSLLGVQKNDAEYVVEFNNQRVELTFMINKVPEILSKIGVKPGDKIINAISYRYTTEQYQKLLNSGFGNNSFYKLDNTILALSKL